MSVEILNTSRTSTILQTNIILSCMTINSITAIGLYHKTRCGRRAKSSREYFWGLQKCGERLSLISSPNSRLRPHVIKANVKITIMIYSPRYAGYTSHVIGLDYITCSRGGGGGRAYGEIRACISHVYITPIILLNLVVEFLRIPSCRII